MWLQRAGQAGSDGLGVWEFSAWTIIYRMDQEQGPTVNTGNCLQYPMTAIVEKDGKKNTSINVNFTPELTQHCEA